MCLLAVQYRLVPESPILVAANREEYYDSRVCPLPSKAENRECYAESNRRLAVLG